MEYLKFILRDLFGIFIFIVIIKVFMDVSAHIGKEFRIGEFFVRLLKKNKKVS